MLRVLLSCFSVTVLPSCAQVCAATPEAAAMAIVGAASGPAPVGTGNIGYRVQDVQTDPLMGRVWVRVSRCGDGSAPLILVPLRTTLAGAPSLQQAPLPPSTAGQEPAARQPVPSVARPMAVHAGDAVKAVFVSAHVQMELDATANGQAAIDGPVEITLARRGDEPAHRMHGVLRAPGRVEVQP